MCGASVPPGNYVANYWDGTLERISKMPQENAGARQVDHPEEVGGIPFPPGDDATEIVKPGKQSFDLPPASPATQRPSVLRAHAAIRPMRRDHLDVVVVSQLLIETVTVIGAVADQAGRELLQEPRGERRVDEGDFMWRSAGHVDGDRKTMAVANRHDFAALTAASRADGGAPFFAELKLASMKASLRSSFPRSRRSSARRCKTRSNRPLRCQA